MSRYHRDACEWMTRAAVSINTRGYWTFGAPSVLMIFHREAGAPDREKTVKNRLTVFYDKLHPKLQRKICKYILQFCRARAELLDGKGGQCFPRTSSRWVVLQTRRGH